jgi:hypothetical protein
LSVTATAASTQPNTMILSVVIAFGQNRPLDSLVAYQGNARGSLRTDEPAFAVYSSTNCLWREYCARHHEAECETNQSKNKTVFGMLTIGISYRLFRRRQFCGLTT